MEMQKDIKLETDQTLSIRNAMPFIAFIPIFGLYLSTRLPITSVYDYLFASVIVLCSSTLFYFGIQLAKTEIAMKVFLHRWQPYYLFIIFNICYGLSYFYKLN